MTIQVRIQMNYGNKTVYPVCEKAKIFAQMLGQKILTSSDIAFIKALGFSVEVVQEPVSL